MSCYLLSLEFAGQLCHLGGGLLQSDGGLLLLCRALLQPATPELSCMSSLSLCHTPELCSRATPT